MYSTVSKLEVSVRKRGAIGTFDWRAFMVVQQPGEGWFEAWQRLHGDTYEPGPCHRTHQIWRKA